MEVMQWPGARADKRLVRTGYWLAEEPCFYPEGSSWSAHFTAFVSVLVFLMQLTPLERLGVSWCPVTPLSVGGCAKNPCALLSCDSKVFNRMPGPFGRQKIIMQLSR